jgi:serine/threonine-protein kinase
VTEPFEQKAPSAASSDSGEHGRFLPGTILARRYRIVGLLGKGGMGEVYRADDLKLGQAVALKLLPERLANDSKRLEYFHNEVRLARQVSHPNVCRVYDIGEVDGQHFLSMEYIDGEDLAGLIRRIGRLPADKGIDVARQLCAGLAAAHDRGVLHRDLKPANVMLDGRGRVRITDFGLARLKDEDADVGVQAGTPAYMAPEQLAGQGVTERSDLYSLGLVLFEVFTGKPVFEPGPAGEMARLREDSSPVTPSNITADVDPAVERAILRCLERDPQHRPQSVMAVAAALPGGDPLAAALAAGETPSPEMVAAAGESGALRPGIAIACLALLLIELCIVALVAERGTAFGEVRRELESPEVLEKRVRNIAEDLGYEKPEPGLSACGFEYNQDYLWHLKEDDSPTRWDLAAIYYWHRRSPEVLAPADLSVEAHPFRVSLDDPPQLLGGMMSFRLDPQGRLLDLRAVPRREEEASGKPNEVDWPVLFDHAELDFAQFSPAVPIRLPPSYADQRIAWKGLHAESGTPIRVEAASYRGQPVLFQLIWPDWTKPERAVPPRSWTPGVLVWIVFLIIIVTAAVLGRRNLRLGRADRKGALRIALYLASVNMLVWLFGAGHVPDLIIELTLFFSAIATACTAVLPWLLYLALEPYVRRLWPESLISWGRLLAGRFHDPLVGRDLLIGAAVGACLPSLGSLVYCAAESLGGPRELSSEMELYTLLGARHLAATFLSMQYAAVFAGLFWLLALVLMRFLLRNQWLAGAVLVLLWTAFVAWGLGFGSGSYVFSLQVVVNTLVFVFVLLRYGLLAEVAAVFSFFMLHLLPITSDFGAWYGESSLFCLAVVAAVGVYGFHASLGSAISRSRSTI